MGKHTMITNVDSERGQKGRDRHQADACPAEEIRKQGQQGDQMAKSHYDVHDRAARDSKQGTVLEVGRSSMHLLSFARDVSAIAREETLVEGALKLRRDFPSLSKR